MSLLISELLHTLGVMVAAFAILSLLAMFLKAEAATHRASVRPLTPRARFVRHVGEHGCVRELPPCRHE